MNDLSRVMSSLFIESHENLVKTIASQSVPK